MGLKDVTNAGVRKVAGIGASIGGAAVRCGGKVKQMGIKAATKAGKVVGGTIGSAVFPVVGTAIGGRIGGAVVGGTIGTIGTAIGAGIGGLTGRKTAPMATDTIIDAAWSDDEQRLICENCFTKAKKQ